MRAGRLVQLVRLLQARGRMTAPQLALELEVSTRTILRDVEALSGAGVPIYSVRGPDGGFELLDAVRIELPSMPRAPARSGTTRAVVRLSPLGRQVALLGGRPAGLRVRRSRPTDADGPRGWVTASFPMTVVAAAAQDVLTLGAEVEVLQPPELRSALAQLGRIIAERHG